MLRDLKANSFFTVLRTWLHGELVGVDAHGNRYYRERGFSGWRKERRWTVFSRDADPTLVPPGWLGWLHKRIEKPPSEQPLPAPRWEKERLPNLTGTPSAYLPPGALERGGRRARATGDYEAWRPPLSHWENKRMLCSFRLTPPPLMSPIRRGWGCQFPDNELITLCNGQKWCRFHLPMTVDNNATVKAQWSEEKIAAFNDAVFSFIDANRTSDRDVDLAGVVFPGDISFEQYAEDNRPLAISFVAASFSGNVTFENVGFCGGGLFDGTEFSGLAWFNGVRFYGPAWFHRTKFGGQAGFGNATFCGSAMFGEARFADRASFHKAKFCGDADFSGMADALLSAEKDEFANTFSKLDFSDAKFYGPVRFHNRKFLDATDFRGAHFEHAPKFHGCILHQDTFFPNEVNFRDRNGAEGALAYRTLKHAMASVDARGEEAKFYVLEQKSLRNDKDTPALTKMFSLLYGLASDYGQSLLRPLVCLLITFIGSVAIYAVVLYFYLNPKVRLVIPPFDLWDLLRFSLRQVFRPFEVFSLRVPAPAEAVHEVLRAPPLPLVLCAALHSVLTLSLVALFLLALRRRFKLD